MLVMLAKKDLLASDDLRRLPPLQQWMDTLRPGIPFAFCIAAVVTALLTATNLATGTSLTLNFQPTLQSNAFPFAFCIAAAITALAMAINLDTGAGLLTTL